MKTSVSSVLIHPLLAIAAVASAFTCPALEVSKPKAVSVVRHERTATEIVRMHQAGVEKNVILAYLRNVRVPYIATADDILYLHGHKISEDVILEWINKGGALLSAAATARQSAAVVARSPDLVAAYSQPTTQIIQSQPVIYQTPPTIINAAPVVYSYPVYTYSGYYGSPWNYGYSYPYWSRWGYSGFGSRYPHRWYGGWHAGQHQRSHGGWGRWHSGHSHHYGRAHFRSGHFGGHRVGFTRHHSSGGRPRR